MRFLAGTEDDGRGADDTALYQKGMALGLDRDDPMVRGLLLEKIRLLLARSPDERTPDDGVLQAYLEAHRDRYVQPSRVTLWHVFLSRDRRGSAITRDAR